MVSRNTQQARKYHGQKAADRSTIVRAHGTVHTQSWRTMQHTGSPERGAQGGSASPDEMSGTIAEGGHGEPDRLQTTNEASAKLRHQQFSLIRSLSVRMWRCAAENNWQQVRELFRQRDMMLREFFATQMRADEASWVGPLLSELFDGDRSMYDRGVHDYQQYLDELTGNSRARGVRPTDRKHKA